MQSLKNSIVGLHKRWSLLNSTANVINRRSYTTQQLTNGNITHTDNLNQCSNDYIRDKSGDLWELVVGVEIHAQTKTKEKLFSNSANIGSVDGLQANSRVSFTDAAFPGTLPILNQSCVEQAIKTGISIGGEINPVSFFDRKHYFYQDLPLGYQITQYTDPIVRGGKMILTLNDGRQHTIRISHIQLEQDSGKSIHDMHPTQSLVDLNRAGIGLMEIVSHADFRSSEQVGLYIKKLQHLLKHVGSSDANMQLGELRCDINISVHKPNTPLGTRVELKNMISPKAIMSSINAEAKRQIQLLEQGLPITRETRGFNQETGETFHMRTKEGEVDYRFFPEPDLPPLVINPTWIETIRESLGEMPEDMKKRIISLYQLSDYEASLLIEDFRIALFFEKSIHHNTQEPRLAKSILPWITRDIFSFINDNNTSFDQINLTIDQFTEFLDLIKTDYLSPRTGKEILSLILKGDKRSPKAITDALGLSQISDDLVLDQLCQSVVLAHPKEVNEYRSGRDRVFKFFVGEIMKKTKGRSSPEKVNTFLRKYLDNK
ncbi:hypothetical protein CYY_002278 [Polysphondylium violaceum]|uniref:Glutamyl-tRNA(Gln) amidotransferase subunit B, mitochondrial n=1 Tax=Polysphondylium violaceum TaxID=133409 RepID=A0A8J4Q831_9MYCE|nr:hypothetical protein CYY_002278 [Polysphondylium violaceum]